MKQCVKVKTYLASSVLSLPNHFCIVTVRLFNANIFLFSQSFKVSLHFFHLIIEVSHQKIDIQRQAKDYLNFKLGKLKEIHRSISRNSNTGGQIPCQQRPPFSGIWWVEGKKYGCVADYEVACFFCPYGNGLFLADFI